MTTRLTRRTARAVFGASFALVLVACASGPPADVGSASESGQRTTYHLSRQCPDTGKMQLVTASIVNRVVSATTLPSWQAGDIGASTRLSDNRIVWVFGDTVRDSSHSPRIVSNSMLISSGLCIAQLLAPNDSAIIPDIAPRKVYWPMSVVRLNPKQIESLSLDPGITDVLVVLSGRIQRGTQSAFDFRFLGASASVFTVRHGAAPQLLETEEISPDSNSTTQINWGAASMIVGNWFYVYGSRQTGNPHEFGRELYVARVPVKRPSERSEWQFYDGRTWQRDLNAAAPVLPASQGVSQTLSVSKIKGRYVIVSKKGGDLGDAVYTWDSRSPVGPWTAWRGIPAPFKLSASAIQYAPLGHPEVPLKSGELLISVSRNTTDLTSLLQHPSAVGRPVFAEVKLP